MLGPLPSALAAPSYLKKDDNNKTRPQHIKLKLTFSQAMNNREQYEDTWYAEEAVPKMKLGGKLLRLNNAVSYLA